MGLDITYYKNLTKLDCLFDRDGDPVHPKTRAPIENFARIRANSSFPERETPLEDGGIYICEEREGFNAGPYSLYNRWREQLAKLAGYPAVEVDEYGTKQMRHDVGAWQSEGGPFYELINFSDCEGTIGPVVSAKLAKDFADFQSKADAVESEDWRESYADWRKAFETAAQNGAVHFH
jgi:hypothetical protein